MPTRGDRATRLAALTLLLTVGCACADSPSETDDPIGRILVEEVSEGYELVRGPASGPLTLDDAAIATSARGTRIRRQLGRTGFQGAHSRIWQQAENDFIVILAFRFLNEARAQELVEFMDAEHKDKQTAQRFSLHRIPNAVGYTLNARTLRSERNLFCQMVWFAHKRVAFEVRACTGQPSSPDTVIELAEAQFRKAGGGFQPDASPSAGG